MTERIVPRGPPHLLSPMDRSVASIARQGQGQCVGVAAEGARTEFDFPVLVRRPREAVFAFLADVQRHVHGPGSPVLEMVKTPPGPTRAGTRWREVVRLAPWTTLTVWSEATAVQPGQLLAMTFRGPGMRGDLTYTLRPVEGGTMLLRQRETLTPLA